MLYNTRNISASALQLLVLFLAAFCLGRIRITFLDGECETFDGCVGKEFDYIHALLELYEKEEMNPDDSKDATITLESITKDLFVLMHEMVHKDPAEISDIEVCEFIGIMYNFGYMAVSSNLMRDFYSKLAIMSLQGRNINDIIELTNEKYFCSIVTKSQSLLHITEIFGMYEQHAQEEETLCAQYSGELFTRGTFNKLIISPEAAFYLLLGFVNNLKVDVDISGGTFKLQRAAGKKISGVTDVDFDKQDIKKLVMDASAMHNIKLGVEKRLEILYWFVFFMEVPHVEIVGWSLNKGCAPSILNLAKGVLRVKKSQVSGDFFQSLGPILFGHSCKSAVHSNCECTAFSDNTEKDRASVVVDVSGKNMSQAECDQLFEVMCTQNCVTHLNITGNTLGKHHLEMISKLSALRVLYMGDCDIPLGSIKCFEEAAFRDTLTELYICENRLDKCDIEAIMTLKGLEALYASYTHMNEKELEDLESILDLRVFFASRY
eukprot:jgi/Antlo1/2150/876